MRKPTTTNPHYADLNAQLAVLCDDFHYAELRAQVATAATTWAALNAPRPAA